MNPGSIDYEVRSSDLKAGLILGSENFIDEIKKKTGLKKHREIP